MSSASRPYRKLSSWRGFFTSAALFRDQHCLICVRSSGYEEHVKRFYFKDIKSIVVSNSHRYAVSRSAILSVLVLLISLLFTSRFAPPLSRIIWVLLGALVLAWLYSSLRASCRCRVYTAVSQEELPSVRRPWTARKFLAELTPLIEAAQGTLPEGWKESLATDHPILLNPTPANSSQQPDSEKRPDSRAGRLTASGVLVASLLLDVLLTGWDMQRPQPMPDWIGSALALIEASAAVWVLIQNRGISANLQRLGAAVLIFLGLTFYGQFGIAGVAQMQAKHPLQTEEIRATPMHRTYLEVYIGGCFILAILGAFLTLAGPTPQRHRVPGD
jgi:hypothetical protein